MIKIVYYKAIAHIIQINIRQNNCEYFDFNQFVRVSDDDGLHYDALAHSIIAKELTKFIHTKYIENNLVRKLK